MIFLAMFLPLVLVLGLLAILIFLFVSMDGDLTLLYYYRFGKSLKEFANKVVWVTGASSGIGEELAVLLARKGARLVLSGTQVDKLNQVRRVCLDEGASEENVLCVPFNIADTEQHEKHVGRVLQHFGQIDVLVNNAGRSQRAAFEEIQLDVDREMFDINVFGLVHLTRLVVQHWYATGARGQVAVTSSTAGILGVPNSATYTATKHALHGYFEALRTESFTKGIRVTIVCPGPVFSNVAQRAFTGQAGETFGKNPPSSAKRMSTERCARLMAVAIVNQLDVAWITIQPVLTMHYLSQYVPTFFRFFLVRYMTPERARRVREGE